MAWYAYGYFARIPSGIVRSGHNFGPTPDTYKIGDSLGVRNGVEGIVIGILKSEPAKKKRWIRCFCFAGAEAGAPTAAVRDFFQTAEGQQLQRMLTGEERLVSRPQIQAVLGDNKFRAVGKYVYRRPLRESFYDFQLNHLLWLLG